MIVWLASYPRSGNLLTRALLHRVFGIASTSEYTPASIGDGTDGDPAFAGTALGAARVRSMQQRIASGMIYSYPGRLDDFLAAAGAGPASVYVKTHGHPRDDSPAIYIVRDGRAALVSYRRLQALRMGDDAPSLSDFIAGKDAFGSWSAHLAAWQPLTRPRTLLLKFEDLLGRTQVAIRAIAEFLRLDPRAPFDPETERQSLEPQFNRGGSNALNIAEMAPADEAVFWELHGAWMERLGYGRALRRAWWARFVPREPR